jgi:hypothetical protein
MQTNFCMLGILISTLTLIIAINQTVNAQSDNFKTYTNNDLGFTVQHPSKWKVDNYTPKSSYFTIREWDTEIAGIELTMRSSFGVGVDKPEPYLDTDTMTLQNRSLAQYVQMQKDVMPKNSETLIRENHVTVGGNDGVKLEYTSNENNKERYGFYILTVVNGKLYTLSYSEEPLKVPETLPLANKMVESFKVIK